MPEISENIIQSKSNQGFWKRQFSQDATPWQMKFDILFGLILPIVCVVADPVVFKTWSANFSIGISPLLRSLRFFAYLEVAIGTVSLIFALVHPHKSSLLAGFLFAGALFSLVLGCLIFPCSVIGIILAGLGLLGFIPFLTSFVFTRNAVRILIRCNASRGNKVNVFLWITSCVVFLVIPLITQLVVNQTIKKQIEIIFTGTHDQAKTAGKKLKYLLPFTEIDYLAFRYSQITDPERSRLIAEVYQEMTGKDINEIWGFID